MKGLVSIIDIRPQKYSDKVCILGGIDSQMVINYPGTTVEQMQAEVRRAIDTFAPYKNYIMSVAGFIPNVERIKIIAAETHRYGMNYWNRS